MERIAKELRREYERWCTQIPPQQAPEVGKVTIEDALKAHVLLLDTFSRDAGEGIGGVGPRSMTLLASAIDRQNVGLGSTSKWGNVFEWSATAFYGMIKNHPVLRRQQADGAVAGVAAAVPLQANTRFGTA